MKKIFIYVFIFFLGLGAFSPIFSVEAQEDKKGFSIAPFFQEVTLENSQEKAKFNLEVSNMTDAPAVFFLSALDFGALDESGGVAFLGATNDLEKKYGLASWISLEKDALAINPGEKQIVPVTIENKESLSPGGHYAAIVLRLENEKNQAEDTNAKINFNSSLASLIFARKIGGEIYEMELKEKTFSGNIFSLPASARLRFQNTGNVHVVPRGLIKITDPLGRAIKKGIINSESGILLPETFRVFGVPLKKISLAFIPGRYAISTEYRYDGREVFETEQVKFFLIPWAFLAIIIILAGVIFSIIAKKRKIKKQDNFEKNNATAKNGKK